MKMRIIASTFVVLLMSITVSAQLPRFTRDTSTLDQPVVTDNLTGLMWQGCQIGASGNTCATSNSLAIKMSWSEAIAACEALDWGRNSDWRLPNRKELFSLIENRSESGFLDLTAFPNTSSAHAFWSSTTKATNDDFAWTVDFTSGSLDSGDKDYYQDDSAARCVRGTSK